MDNQNMDAAKNQHTGEAKEQPRQYGGAPQGQSPQYNGAPQAQPQQYIGAPQAQPQQYNGMPQVQPQQYNGAPQGQYQQYNGMPQGQMSQFSGAQPLYQPMPPAKKSGAGARIGYFFLAWLPMIACIVLQVACLLVLVIPATAFAMISNGADFSNMNVLMMYYYNTTMKMASAGVFFYHIVGVAFFGLWYYLGFKKPRPKVFGSFRALNVKNIAIAVIAGVGLCFFANGTVVVEAVLLPQMVEEYIQMAEVAGLGTDVFVIFASIILAPIGEEFLCRGVILRYARKSLSKFWMANCLQALMFGIIHMNWVQGIYAFVIGLVLGWLVERYRSILPAIILHFIVNLSSSTWIGYVLEPLPATLPIGIILLAASTIVVVGTLLWGGRRPKESGADTNN